MRVDDHVIAGNQCTEVGIRVEKQRIGIDPHQHVPRGVNAFQIRSEPRLAFPRMIVVRRRPRRVVDTRDRLQERDLFRGETIVAHDERDRGVVRFPRRDEHRDVWKMIRVRTGRDDARIALHLLAHSDRQQGQPPCPLKTITGQSHAPEFASGIALYRAGNRGVKTSA